MDKKDKSDKCDKSGISKVSRSRSILSYLSLSSLILLLSACIFVDDFGEAWKDAAPDTCITKLAGSIYYTELRRDPEGKDMSRLARVLTIEDQHFLLLKQEESDKGGRLYRFDVVPGSVGGGIFERYRLDPTMRDAFARDYPHAPVNVGRDTVTIAGFDAATEKLLLTISRKPEYWQVEEKALYNVLHDPECHFTADPPKGP